MDLNLFKQDIIYLKNRAYVPVSLALQRVFEDASRWRAFCETNALQALSAEPSNDYGPQVQNERRGLGSSSRDEHELYGLPISNGGEWCRDVANILGGEDVEFMDARGHGRKLLRGDAADNAVEARVLGAYGRADDAQVVGGIGRPHDVELDAPILAQDAYGRHYPQGCAHEVRAIDAKPANRGVEVLGRNIHHNARAHDHAHDIHADSFLGDHALALDAPSVHNCTNNHTGDRPRDVEAFLDVRGHDVLDTLGDPAQAHDIVAIGVRDTTHERHGLDTTSARPHDVVATAVRGHDVLDTTSARPHDVEAMDGGGPDVLDVDAHVYALGDPAHAHDVVAIGVRDANALDTNGARQRDVVALDGRVYAHADPAHAHDANNHTGSARPHDVVATAIRGHDVLDTTSARPHDVVATAIRGHDVLDTLGQAHDIVAIGVRDDIVAIGVGDATHERHGLDTTSERHCHNVRGGTVALVTTGAQGHDVARDIDTPVDAHVLLGDPAHAHDIQAIRRDRQAYPHAVLDRHAHEHLPVNAQVPTRTREANERQGHNVRGGTVALVTAGAQGHDFVAMGGHGPDARDIDAQVDARVLLGNDVMVVDCRGHDVRGGGGEIAQALEGPTNALEGRTVDSYDDGDTHDVPGDIPRAHAHTHAISYNAHFRTGAIISEHGLGLCGPGDVKLDAPVPALNVYGRRDSQGCCTEVGPALVGSCLATKDVGARDGLVSEGRRRATVEDYFSDEEDQGETEIEEEEEEEDEDEELSGGTCSQMNIGVDFAEYIGGYDSDSNSDSDFVENEEDIEEDLPAKKRRKVKPGDKSKGLAAGGGDGDRPRGKREDKRGCGPASLRYGELLENHRLNGDDLPDPTPKMRDLFFSLRRVETEQGVNQIAELLNACTQGPADASDFDPSHDVLESAYFTVAKAEKNAQRASLNYLISCVNFTAACCRDSKKNSEKFQMLHQKYRLTKTDRSLYTYYVLGAKYGLIMQGAGVHILLVIIALGLRHDFEKLWLADVNLLAAYLRMAKCGKDTSCTDIVRDAIIPKLELLREAVTLDVIGTSGVDIIADDNVLNTEINRTGTYNLLLLTRDGRWKRKVTLDETPLHLGGICSVFAKVHPNPDAPIRRWLEGLPKPKALAKSIQINMPVNLSHPSNAALSKHLLPGKGKEEWAAAEKWTLRETEKINGKKTVRVSCVGDLDAAIKKRGLTKTGKCNQNYIYVTSDMHNTSDVVFTTKSNNGEDTISGILAAKGSIAERASKLIWNNTAQRTTQYQNYFKKAEAAADLAKAKKKFSAMHLGHFGSYLEKPKEDTTDGAELTYPHLQPGNKMQRVLGPSQDMRRLYNHYDDMTQDFCDIYSAVDRLITEHLPGYTYDLKETVELLEGGVNPQEPPFLGLVVNFQARCRAHRDVKDLHFCVVIPFGDFEGGELVLYELGLVIQLLCGDIFIFMSHSITHFNLPYTGDRGSLVLHTDKSAQRFAKDKNGWESYIR